MRNSEDLSTQASVSELDTGRIPVPHAVAVELQNTVHQLTKLFERNDGKITSDNKEFLEGMINECLLVGKSLYNPSPNVFYDNIVTMITQQYPTMTIIKHQDVFKLFPLCKRFIKQILPDLKIDGQYINSQSNLYIDYKDQLEYIVHDTYNMIINDIEVNILGEI